MTIGKGFQGILRIQEIKFNEGCSKVVTGIFPCEMKILVGNGKYKVVKTKLDVKNVAAAAKFLADLVIPGLGKYAL